MARRGGRPEPSASSRVGSVLVVAALVAVAVVAGVRERRIRVSERTLGLR